MPFGNDRSLRHHVFDEAYRLYRSLQNTTHTSGFALGRRRAPSEIVVTLLGLWDTVGPLGTPNQRAEMAERTSLPFAIPN